MKIKLITFILLFSAFSYCAFSQLYVTDDMLGSSAGIISQFAQNGNGNIAPDNSANTGITATHSVYGICVDNSEIFVVSNSSDQIRIYNKTTFALSRTITGGNTLLSAPRYICVDENYIYLTNGGDGSILVFNKTDNGNIAPQRQISGSSPLLNDPWGIAVDNNYIYVCNKSDGTDFNGTIKVFNKTDNGDIAALRTIDNNDSPLELPEGLCVDDNYIYVTNTNDGTIQVYNKSDDGDVAPISTFTSNALLSIYGLCVDDSFVYVVSNANSSVVVFNKTDNGNVTPQRIISGVNTQLTTPIGIACLFAFSSSSIPTLPEWGLILFAVIFAGLGGWFVWKKVAQ